MLVNCALMTLARSDARGEPADCDSASDLATLDGTEGAATRTYFTCLMEFNKSELTWPGRQKHPAPDPP